MSKPGSSWLQMPVTETVHPVLSKILTSEPARPPLAPLSIRDPGRVFRHMIDVGFVDRVRGGIGIHQMLKGGVIKGEGFIGLSVVQISVYRRIWRVGSLLGVSVGFCSG